MLVHDHIIPRFLVLLQSSTWTVCCILLLQVKQPVAAATTVSADLNVAPDQATSVSTTSQSELSTAARDGSVM